MAITVNSTLVTGGQPSATHRSGTINVDLDATSILNGYDLSAVLPTGITVRASAYVPHYDGSALRWFRIVDVAGVPRLQAYADTNSAPGALVGAGVNLSGHTGLEVTWSGE
jgi:hypothetical protein